MRLRKTFGVSWGLALVTVTACGTGGGPGEGPTQGVDGGGVLDGQPVLPTACRTELGSRGVAFTPEQRMTERPANRPDLECLIEDPVLLQPVINGITFHPDSMEAAPEPLFATCSLALAIERMTRMLAERGVTAVVHFGIYGCRVIAGTDMLSEHARARALDIAGLRLASGDTYTVLADWEKDQPMPASAGGRFLRELATALFDGGVFNIILTPDFNADHRNHFHLDLTPQMRFFR